MTHTTDAHRPRPRTAAAAALALLAAGAAACGSDVGGRHDGGGTPDTTAPDTVTPDTVTPDTVTPDGTDNCDERARWIYLVDSEDAFLVFKPDTMTLTEIGRLSCPTNGSPFSMAVDRQANAWVLHQFADPFRGGEIFKVNTATAACEATSFRPNQSGLQLFGMGFASNAEGSNEETLFIAGGESLSISSGSSMLAAIDMATFTVRTIRQVVGWPELTGTGLGELWGFFPTNTPPSVQKIDKTSGYVSNTYNLPTLDTGAVEAWAFAFWGGDFFMFLQTSADLSSNIWKLEAGDGSVTNAVPNTGYRIVGAGVSTCAPTTFI